MKGLGFGVLGFGLWVLGFGFWDLGSGFRADDSGFRVRVYGSPGDETRIISEFEAFSGAPPVLGLMVHSLKFGVKGLV